MRFIARLELPGTSYFIFLTSATSGERGVPWSSERYISTWRSGSDELPSQVHTYRERVQVSITVSVDHMLSQVWSNSTSRKKSVITVVPRTSYPVKKVSGNSGLSETHLTLKIIGTWVCLQSNSNKRSIFELNYSSLRDFASNFCQIWIRFDRKQNGLQSLHRGERIQDKVL